MAKVKIRLKSPKKLAWSLVKLAVFAAVIVFAVMFLSGLGADPVEKELKKLEVQDIKVIETRIAVYKGEDEYKGTELKAGDVLSFKVIYKYQLTESQVVKNHPVETGVSVVISDPAYADPGEKPNTVKVREGISQDTPITFKVGYSENRDLVKEFTFTILSDTAPADEDGGSDGE